MKYSKTRVQIHPKEGLKVETYASPFVRACIGIAVVLIALGLALLMATPFIKAWT
nr:MAG TPA: Kinocilin protein [Caudoviricetes sp.]